MEHPSDLTPERNYTVWSRRLPTFPACSQRWPSPCLTPRKAAGVEREGALAELGEAAQRAVAVVVQAALQAVPEELAEEVVEQAAELELEELEVVVRVVPAAVVAPRAQEVAWGPVAGATPTSVAPCLATA